MAEARVAITVLALVLGLVLGGCSGDSKTVAKTALPTVVLQPADLPGSFERFDQGRLRASEQPEGRTSDPARFGRIDGWKSRFRRPGEAGGRGPYVVESRVDLFRGDGAEEELAALRSLLRGVEPNAGVGAPGDESFTWTTRQPGEPRDILTTAVVWREHGVVASVTATGFAGGLELEDVIALARKQHARIGRAAR